MKGSPPSQKPVFKRFESLSSKCYGTRYALIYRLSIAYLSLIIALIISSTMGAWEEMGVFLGGAVSIRRQRGVCMREGGDLIRRAIGDSRGTKSLASAWQRLACGTSRHSHVWFMCGCSLP